MFNETIEMILEKHKDKKEGGYYSLTKEDLAKIVHVVEKEFLQNSQSVLLVSEKNESEFVIAETMRNRFITESAQKKISGIIIIESAGRGISTMELGDKALGGIIDTESDVTKNFELIQPIKIEDLPILKISDETNRGKGKKSDVDNWRKCQKRNSNFVNKVLRRAKLIRR